LTITQQKYIGKRLAGTLELEKTRELSYEKKETWTSVGLDVGNSLMTS
jgi:hypothetical protein